MDLNEAIQRVRGILGVHAQEAQATSPEALKVLQWASIDFEALIKQIYEEFGYERNQLFVDRALLERKLEELKLQENKSE